MEDQSAWTSSRSTELSEGVCRGGPDASGPTGLRDDRVPSSWSDRHGYDRLVGSDADAVTRAWREAQESLPEGWHLDGLRCASTGLAEGERSDEWIAMAVGPAGEERDFRAGDPVAALIGLAAVIG